MLVTEVSPVAPDAQVQKRSLHCLYTQHRPAFTRGIALPLHAASPSSPRAFLMRSPPIDA